MKQLFLGLFIILCSSASFGQSSKIGFVDISGVIQMLPEYENAANQLNTYGESIITPAIKSKSEQIQKKYETYQAQETTMGAARKEVEQKEIIQMEQELQQLHQQNQTNEKFSKKQQELFAPLQNKAYQAIESVAKENGFTVVFDAANSPVIYAQESTNMMPLIKAKIESSK